MTREQIKESKAVNKIYDWKLVRYFKYRMEKEEKKLKD